MNETDILKEQLRQQQKLASLGLLSAGIAHEIQNPLNFVINFAKLSNKLLADMKDVVEDVEDSLDPDDAADLHDIADDLSVNMQKIQEHGERAISIIQGILLISRGKENEVLPTDIPHLIHEYLWLSYHAKRANDKSFNVTINEDYQEGMPQCNVIPQDLSRAIINVMNNACYAVHTRDIQEKANGNSSYSPTISVKAYIADGKLMIAISDNGSGISDDVKARLFHETVTTKPIGEGTGLGMQLTYDIITKNHKGELTYDSTTGEGTTFTFAIPVA